VPKGKTVLQRQGAEPTALEDFPITSKQALSGIFRLKIQLCNSFGLLKKTQMIALINQ